MNYQQIIDLALSYSDRTDSDIVNRMGDFVDIVEARINRAIRTSQMATTSLVVTEEGQERFGLPQGFAGMRSIKVREKSATKGITAQYLNPEQLNQATKIDGDSGSIYYTVLANQLQLYPSQDDKVLEIVYYKLLDGLDTVDDTNWVSDRYPDVYVFGLVVEIEAFVKNPAGAEMWNQRFDTALSEMSQEDQIDRWSGTPLTIKAE